MTTSGPTLFKRAWNVTVGTLSLTQADLSFKIRRTLHQEPNTCDLRLFNLTPAHRGQIEQQPSSPLATIPVSVQAGYVNLMSQIFLGQLRAGFTVTDGPDIVTELSNGDGEQASALGRLNNAYGPHTPISQVLPDIVGGLGNGVGQGNVQSAIAALQAKGLTEFSAKGQVLKGNAADHLTDFCASAGLEWSIQNGAVQILGLNQPLGGQALSLSASSGLIGSPSVDNKGVLDFTTLLIPGIDPGAQVVLDSLYVQGNYRVIVVESTGDTISTDWYHRVQAQRLS